MEKRGTRFAVASTAACRRTVGGQRRQIGKLCQGRQPPKAGPLASHRVNPCGAIQLPFSDWHNHVISVLRPEANSSDSDVS
jgi:hypothetical protein